MIDHVGIAVTDTARSRAFYDAALAPIGITLMIEIGGADTESGGDACGYGKDGRPFFWFGDNETVGKGFHVGFAVETRAEVDAFHKAALAAGGTDNGAPGIREIYHPDYYAAFVICPDGHNLEAVCHLPEASNDAQQSM